MQVCNFAFVPETTGWLRKARLYLIFPVNRPLLYQAVWSASKHETFLGQSLEHKNELSLLGTLGTCKSSFLHVPRIVLEKVHFCIFLRTVLEKVSCFDSPTRLGTKGADLRGISNTNLPFLVNLSFLVQKQNYKLAFRKLTKRQVEATQTCLPFLL